jgi:hypothetical protein
MKNFMRIVFVPEEIHNALKTVAGGN